MQKEKIVKKNTMILLSTVETHDCDPQEDCRECHGSGKCHDCKGQGENDCHKCHGSGHCTSCNGRGQERCKKCNGSGKCTECHGKGGERCSKCHGTGVCQTCSGSKKIDCPDCHGHGFLDNGIKCPTCYGKGKRMCPDCANMLSPSDGRCHKCNGTGEIKCSKCGGSGNCTKCSGSGNITCSDCSGSGNCRTCTGSGKLTCKTCNGSGDCQNCHATGKVTCGRCEGSGWFQTYRAARVSDYLKGARCLSLPMADYHLEEADGDVAYKGVYREWSSFQHQKSDTEAERDRLVETKLGNDTPRYKACLDEIKQTEAFSPDSPSDGPMRSQMEVNVVDHVKIRYIINGKEYSVDLLGNNHIGIYDDVPTVMEEFKLSKIASLKLALTQGKRIKAMGLLAAWIYGCDGWKPEEMRMMKCLAAEISSKPAKQSKLMQQWHSVHTTLSQEQLMKKIKPLLHSRKTISFAWHCINVDHEATEREIGLFNALTACYKNLTSQDIDTLKLRAMKFNKLTDEYLIKEYADISPEFAGIRKKLYTLIAVLIGFVCFIGGFNWLVNSVENDNAIEISLAEEIEPDGNLERDASDDIVKGDAPDDNVDTDSDITIDNAIDVRNFNGSFGKEKVEMELTFEGENNTVWGTYNLSDNPSVDYVVEGSFEVTSQDSFARKIKAMLYVRNPDNGNTMASIELTGSIADNLAELTGKYLDEQDKSCNVHILSTE